MAHKTHRTRPSSSSQRDGACREILHRHHPQHGDTRADKMGWHRIVTWSRRYHTRAVLDLVTLAGDRFREIRRLMIRATPYFLRVQRWAYHRVLFSTKEGSYLGFGHEAVQPGDEVYITSLAPVPFVLRPLGRTVETNLHEARYLFIGEFHVHGVIHGDLFERDAQ
ncbi:hypothetical protein B0H66DRAFT_389732 [Apodospora peruviana]|uniref:Uncharacterized protein n=1 Tax=Apodospora peruviana TaxID=516989 RepID=A0AAE0LY91_9PEZI|nr:hypothetical protein B0H66DRAFT_389732 [Apodospora peruviana]